MSRHALDHGLLFFVSTVCITNWRNHEKQKTMVPVVVDASGAKQPPMMHHNEAEMDKHSLQDETVTVTPTTLYSVRCVNVCVA